MATDTAPAFAPTEPARRRQFWQLPTFLLGLTAAIVAWKVVPPRPLAAGSDFERNRTALRRAVEKRTIDVKELEQLLGAMPLSADTVADPQTHFWVGSAHLVLAERGVPDEAADRWSKAYLHLSRCDPSALADGQTAALYSFRTAKASAATGVGDPVHLVSALDTVPPGEEPGERARLLAETCLRMNPPDVKRAKTEFSLYLGGQARGSAGTLAKYRLKLSELCVTTHEPEKARAWLKEIGPDAPPESLSAAKLQLARLAVADRDLNEATKLFQAAEQVPGLPADQRAGIRYEAGRGLIGLGNATTGREYYMKAIADGGPAGTAARVRLAELIARQPTPKEAVEHLEAATRGLKQASDFNNSYVSITELRGTFEAVITACRTAGDFDSAERCTVPYRVVAEDSRDRVLWSEVQAGWGEVQLAGGQAVDGKSRLTQAAAEFVKLAEVSRSAPDRANRLSRAVEWYRAAGDTAGVTAVLNSLATLPGASADVAATANLARAEQMLASGQFDEAVKLLNSASQVGGAAGTKAKVKLALAHTAEGKRRMATKATEKDGRTMLEYGLDLLTQVANKTFETVEEKLAHQEALYELGRLLISPNLPGVLNYPEAETRFRRLLREYPNGQYSELGGLYLGICLTQLALGTHKNGVVPADAERKFTEAKDIFDGLTKAKNDWVRTHADMRQVHTLLLMKQYDTLPPLCDRLAAKYQGRVQELVVLNMLYAGYLSARRPDQAKPVLERMEKVFKALPDTAFSNEMTEYTKAHWTNWFAEQRR